MAQNSKKSPATVANVESVVDQKKNSTKRKVLQYLFKNGSTTIATLSTHAKTSIPSMTAIVEELMAEKWIKDSGLGYSNYGRKPVLYGLNPTERLVAVIDFNIHESTFTLISLQNDILYKRSVPINLLQGETLHRDVVAWIHETLKHTNIKPSRIMGMGLTMPGLINPKTGINHTYKTNKPLAETISAEFSFPVYTINDTQATILGESLLGLAKGHKHVLSLHLDWGVGMGILINGEVYQGAEGFAGELGHVQLEPNGEKCHCGKTGCLNSIASVAAIVKRFKEAAQAGKIPQYTDNKDLQSITIETIINLANEGDPTCKSIFYETAYRLGKGISAAVQLFNPELIILNGILANADKLILRPLEEAIETYCLPEFKQNLRIEISKLGEKAKILGAQSYTWGQFLKESI